MTWSECTNETGESCISTDCNPMNIWMRIGCILSYSGTGTTKDIVLNYSLLGIDLLACFFISWKRNRGTQPRRLIDLLALFFVVLFQIVLCLIVDCVGISIVWCAMAGWIISERKVIKEQQNVPESAQHIFSENTSTEYQTAPSVTDNGNNDNDNISNADPPNVETFLKRILLAVLLLNSATIVYYMVTSPVITTVAHGCAIVLGAVLSELSQGDWETMGLDSSRVHNADMSPSPAVSENAAAVPLLYGTDIASSGHQG